MKKKIIALFMMLFFITTVYSEDVITFVFPDGLPALSIVKMINDDKKISGKKIDYKLEKISESLVMNFLKKESDIGIVPSNLAGQLYNKNLNYKIIGTVGWGSFYIVSREDIKSIKNLKGKKIYTIGKGLTPDIILQTILKENGIIPDKDLEINYLSGGNELAPMYLAGKIDTIMVSEPILSKIISKDSKSKINFDMNDEWKKVFKNDIGFPQSTLIVKESLIKEEPEFVSAFINELESSIEFIYSENPAKEKYIIESKITIDLSVLDEILKRVNIKFISADNSRETYQLYFENIEKINSKAIGGKIPDEKIFISK
ncbi:ABC transporter substrate-binding protein [Fusobacterium sp.]|uniref:ABC transporter substrate-binding protein n=1 Tax=Fusobacterium sp. TaxID=68766 RepID=UPI0029004516|nr:ABC transporter substrate-binding protein [Fusobacterium sp.]MDU1910795.1 ABC transporter substrate-binding protein [Fusobacterium sp.]